MELESPSPSWYVPFMRFFFGFLLGLLCLAGYVGFQQYQKGEDPCLGHCGAKTQCREGTCELIAEAKTSKRKGKRSRRRRRGKRRQSASNPAQPALRTPSAKDLRSVARGPSLRKTDYVDLSSAGGTQRELSGAEISHKVRRLDPKIVACIDRARGDYDIAGGKVLVGLRVERSGRVKQVKVTAPRVMQRAGLHACIKPLITSLVFPPSARSIIMTYPYSLR